MNKMKIRNNNKNNQLMKILIKEYIQKDLKKKMIHKNNNQKINLFRMIPLIFKNNNNKKHFQPFQRNNMKRLNNAVSLNSFWIIRNLI